MSFIFRMIFILLDFGVSLYLVFNSVKAMHQVKVQYANMQDFLNAKKGFYNCAKISVVIKLLYWFIIPKVDNVIMAIAMFVLAWFTVAPIVPAA